MCKGASPTITPKRQTELFGSQIICVTGSKVDFPPPPSHFSEIRVSHMS